MYEASDNSSVAKEKVGRAQAPIRYGKVWIQFDSSLKEFEPSLSVAGEGEFEPLSGGLQSLERRTERLFQRLIEARQRICGLSQLRAKACGCDSQFVYDLIPLTDVRLLFGQGCSRPAVERPHLQMVAIAGIADRLGDHQLAVGLAADLAGDLGRQLCSRWELELRQGAGDFIDAQNVQIGRLLHFVAQSCV